MRRASRSTSEGSLKKLLLDAAAYGTVVFAMCLAVTAENPIYCVLSGLILGFCVWKARR